MNKKQALQRIMEVLENTESDIDSVIEDLWQDGYDEGYNQGAKEAKSGIGN